MTERFGSCPEFGSKDLCEGCNYQDHLHIVERKVPQNWPSGMSFPCIREGEVAAEAAEAMVTQAIKERRKKFASFDADSWFTPIGVGMSGR